MSGRVKLAILVGLGLLALGGFALYSHFAFPKDTTPEGAYARIAIAMTKGNPRDCFAYLETEAQWASYTIRDLRTRSAAAVRAAYPEPEKSALLASYRGLADVPDGADAWLTLAQGRGFIDRLRRDLSGVKRVEVTGDRATVETARGTRYPFRRRENGIWGLTIFTAELLAEADKASHDFYMVTKSASDYRRGGASVVVR